MAAIAVMGLWLYQCTSFRATILSIGSPARLSILTPALVFSVTVKGDSNTAQYDRSINIYYRDFDYPSVILISENKESTTEVD